METFLNIFLFPYTAIVFMFKYAIATLGWIGLIMWLHYLITHAEWNKGYFEWKFRNPFYRD